MALAASHAASPSVAQRLSTGHGAPPLAGRMLRSSSTTELLLNANDVDLNRAVAVTPATPRRRHSSSADSVTPDPCIIQSASRLDHNQVAASPAGTTIARPATAVLHELDAAASPPVTDTAAAPPLSRPASFHRRGRVLTERSVNAAAPAPVIPPCIIGQSTALPPRRPLVRARSADDILSPTRSARGPSSDTASPTAGASPRELVPPTRVVRTEQLMTKYTALMRSDAAHISAAAGIDYTARGSGVAAAAALATTSRSSGPLSELTHIVESAFSAARDGEFGSVSAALGAAATNRCRCMHACFMQATDAVKQGIMSVGVHDCIGETLLMVAAQSSAHDFASFLLAQPRVDVDDVDMMGNTALHYACLHGDRRMQLLLQQHGADERIKNNKGKLCTDFLLLR